MTSLKINTYPNDEKGKSYNPYKEPVKIVIIVYVLFSIISFGYALITGNYNGDFINSRVNLNLFGLLIAFVITIIPYIILYQFYTAFSKKKSKWVVLLNSKILYPITVAIFLIHIALGFLFGVGRAGGEEYSVPTVIKPLIQIMIRISPLTWGTILLMVIPKKQYSKIVFILCLFLLLGIAKAAFGLISLILPIIFIKYYHEIRRFFIKHKIIVVICFLLLPSIVQSGYEFRSQLRGDGYELPEEGMTLICGKLVGRLSSFSNTAILIEKAPQYILVAKNIDAHFFEKGMLSANSQYFTVENRPEKILMLDERVPENSSFILGSGGILIFSLYVSPRTFITNLILILSIYFIIFKLCSLYKNPLGATIATLLLLGPTLSGVAGEYFLDVVLICSSILLISLINNWIAHTKTIASNET